MNTKDKILQALQELYDEYDPCIKNPYYRGPMQKIPAFTYKQIAEKVGISVPTVRKWVKILYKEKLVDIGVKPQAWKADLHIIIRTDFKPVTLHFPTYEEEQELSKC